MQPPGPQLLWLKYIHMTRTSPQVAGMCHPPAISTNQVTDLLSWVNEAECSAAGASTNAKEASCLTLSGKIFNVTSHAEAPMAPTSLLVKPCKPLGRSSIVRNATANRSQMHIDYAAQLPCMMDVLLYHEKHMAVLGCLPCLQICTVVLSCHLRQWQVPVA